MLPLPQSAEFSVEVTEQVQFVALSKFVIVNGTASEVKQAFRERPHLVDSVPGFVRLEVMSPVHKQEEIWLITYWTQASAFHQWHKSHSYRESHKGIPKGIRLEPRETELMYFDFICS